MNHSKLDGDPDPGPGFTDKQGQYLAFIYAYSIINGRPPAEADMQHFFEVSPPSVHQMVVNLQRAGLITKTPGTPRSIEILINPKWLPILKKKNCKPSNSL